MAFRGCMYYFDGSSWQRPGTPMGGCTQTECSGTPNIPDPSEGYYLVNCPSWRPKQKIDLYYPDNHSIHVEPYPSNDTRKSRRKRKRKTKA